MVDVDVAAALLLERTGWQRPEHDDLPTGAEPTKRHLTPFAATAELAPPSQTRRSWW